MIEAYLPAGDGTSPKKRARPAPDVPPVLVSKSRDAKIDHEFFHRFQEGEQAAMAEVVRTHQDRIVAYLRLCTGSVEVAEEIAQEAFLRLYRDRSRIHGPDKILPWVLVTARRMAIKEMKRLRYRSEFSIAEPTLTALSPATDGTQADGIQREEVNRIVEEEMVHLKPRERELIALRYYSGLQIKEIADVMSLPMGSVGVYLRRALDKLRDRLDKRGVTQEDL